MNPKILTQIGISASNQAEALKAIANFAFVQKIIENEQDVETLFNALVEREQIATTAFEDGFAIPHAQIEKIVEPAVVLTRFENSLVWNEAENKDVEIAIALLIPKAQAGSIHVDILAKVATLLLDDQFRQQLKTMTDSEQINQFLLDQINKKEEIEQPVANNSEKPTVKIVGVSACATGVAHTYMAKEALEKAGKELNWEVKIETQGQKGIEFKLSDEEIAAADAVVFATDIYVDPERFMGKKFLKVKTNDAIHNPKLVLEQSLEQELNPADAKKSSQKGAIGTTEFKNSKVKIFMGHLLSGVSRMIPFIVFSGIIWAIFNSVEQAMPELKDVEAFKVAIAVSKVGFTVFIAMMGGVHSRIDRRKSWFCSRFY